MTRPGGRLRVMAARVCGAKTMERLIDPLVADLQTEYAEAVRQGRVWTSRKLRMAGYVAFLKVIASCQLEGSMRPLHGWTVDDRQTVARTIGISMAGIIAATVLTQLPFWLSVPTATWEVQQRLLANSVLQAVPFALPVGLMLGILYGLRGRIVSSRVKMTILVLAAVCSAASLLTLGWILPSATQAFRVFVHGDEAANFMKNSGQMTVGELGDQIDAYEATPMSGSRFARELTLEYHRRWAISCVALVLALLVLSAVSLRRAGRLVPLVAAFVVYSAYYAVLRKAHTLGMSGALSPFVAAWFPNVVFVLGSAALMAANSRRAKATV
jgi:Lipopolysaccharide export system permease LptF/LptG